MDIQGPVETSMKKLNLEPATMSLDDLPTELIHRIASYCDVGDIHALTCVSRSLQTACSDPFVFQAQLRRHAPGPESQKVVNENALAHSINASLSASHPSSSTEPGQPSPEARTIWSHIAAVAPSLPDLSDELDELMLPYRAVSFQPAGGVKLPSADVLRNTRSVIGTFATFSVFGYVSAIDLGVAAAIPGLLIALTDPHNWAIHSYTETGIDLLVRQQAFCLALGLLQTQVLNNMGVMTYHLSNMATWDEERTAFFKFKESCEGRQTIALLAQAVLAHLLRSSFAGRPAREYLPSPERLPFADKALLPLPSPVLPDEAKRRVSAFSSTESWDRWNRTYVRRLAEDMEDGEWFGYFTWDTARSEATFLETGPVENIRFERGEQKPSSNSRGGGVVYEVRALECKEPSGSFALEGEFFQELQSLVLRKIHPNGFEYNFRGWFTPLGIAGTLDPSPWGMPGWFWLWKREWRSEPEPSL